MGNLTILALRIVLALALVGSLFVQVGDGAAHVDRSRRRAASVRIPVLVIVVLGILTCRSARCASGGC